MNKFIKNVCSAIAIACGSAVLVGGDYCAYASQGEEHYPGQYDEAFLEAVKQVFDIGEDGRARKRRSDGRPAGIGKGNILWFFDRQHNKVIMLYSKEQKQNAEELARSMRQITRKEVLVLSLDEAMRLEQNYQDESLRALFLRAGMTLFGQGDNLFVNWNMTMFNKRNYVEWLKKTNIEDEELAKTAQTNIFDSKNEGWSIFISCLSHTEPIFVYLVANGVFNPDHNVGVYSILNPCNSCKWLFDTTTRLECGNCFQEGNRRRIFFHYLAIDGQHREKKSKVWDARWHIWRPTTYNRGYNYGDNDIADWKK